MIVILWFWFSIVRRNRYWTDIVCICMWTVNWGALSVVVSVIVTVVMMTVMSMSIG